MAKVFIFPDRDKVEDTDCFVSGRDGHLYHIGCIVRSGIDEGRYILDDTLTDTVKTAKVPAPGLSAGRTYESLAEAVKAVEIDLLQAFTLPIYNWSGQRKIANNGGWAYLL